MRSKESTDARQAGVQEVCIDLPGETVQCWRSSDKVRVVLRKHRDVFFDINLKAGAIYTVVSKGDFYNPREKKLTRKASFADGERLHLWVGRGFRHQLTLKCSGVVLGTYTVHQFDSKDYGSDPKAKPEPLMVVMGQAAETARSTRAADGAVWRSTAMLDFKPSIDPKLEALKRYGTIFDYGLPAGPTEVHEYVAVTMASTYEVLPNVRVRLERGEAVEGKIEEIFVPPPSGVPKTSLYSAMAAAVEALGTNPALNSNVFKEAAGYIQENYRILNKLLMTVRIEAKKKGTYRVIMRGRKVSSVIAQVGGAAETAKVVHTSAASGTKAAAFMDGGFARTGKNGLGGVRRIVLTSLSNFRSGMKIQVIGTIIDIVGDANTVFVNEAGSRDLSEFLGRAGVSVAKAGATTALGGVLIAVGLGAAGAIIGASAVPVLLVALVVVGGYVLAATAVDKLDEKLNIKERVAVRAR